jgi:hypothetical protein
MGLMNMFLMRLPGNLTLETMGKKIMCLTMLPGQQREKHGLLKCGSTGVLLEIRVICVEPLVLCVVIFVM